MLIVIQKGVLNNSYKQNLLTLQKSHNNEVGFLSEIPGWFKIRKSTNTKKNIKIVRERVHTYSV